MADKEVRKLAAVMFTDIEGYTALVQKNEKVALQKVAIHRKYLEEFTEQYNGKVIAFYGDGSLSVYESALDAVHCGMAMQRAYQADEPVPVRVGIHLGDIVFKNETVFGDGVNIASRIQTSGIPGSVYISDRVQAELKNHPEIRTRSIGRKKLKNVAQPIEVFVITNEGMTVPSVMSKMPDLRKSLKYIPLVLIAGLIIWWLERPVRDYFTGNAFTAEAISVPLFDNLTGDPSLDQIAQMASHWVTKELSVTSGAQVVSYESASEMIQLAGISLSSAQGQKKYQALTGAVNIVEGNYMRIGSNADSLLMSAFIKSLQTGLILLSLDDVKCSSVNPLDCIKSMSDQIKGYWVSRGDHVLTPPTYEAYKAYLAARKAWRSGDGSYIMDQLNKAITLDPGFIDPYFLMLDYFFNSGEHQAAADTLESMRRRFTDLDPRQQNMIMYHTADVEGRNDEVYRYFLNEYKEDPKDLFTNTSGMYIAMMYKNNPVQALKFFNDIPFDSLHIDGCSYCASRLECAMWAALDMDSMALADILAPKISNALYARQSYGMLVMYHIWKNDTTAINQVIRKAKEHKGLDRNWNYLNYLAGRFFLLRGDSTLSSVYARKAMLDPYDDGGRMVARIHYLDGQLQKAKTLYLIAQRSKPKDSQITAELGMVYARLGDKENAMKSIESLTMLRTPYEYGATEYFQGRIYALLGDFEMATQLLRSSLEKGKKFEIWATFHHDPDIKVLEGYPPYQELMRKVKE